MTCASPSSSYDIKVGFGDNRPYPSWSFPFDITGSHFTLTISRRGTDTTFTSDAGDLVLDSANNRVTWQLTSAFTSSVPAGNECSYRLRRTIVGGETRIYATGTFFTVNHPVDVSDVTIAVAGPQGAPGAPGLQGKSAYDLYVDQGGTLTLDGWLASLKAGSSSVPTYTASTTLSGHRVVMFLPDDSVVLADPNAPGYMFAGVTLGAAQAGALVQISSSGQINEPSWSWTPKLNVFAIANGLLTQTPPSIGVLHVIGTAINATTLLIAPQTPITIL